MSVGAGTEAEMKQKKARVEDALHATRAAVEEGIVPGGGVALVRCREAVEKARSQAKGDEKIGVDIVLGALEAPLRQIAENAGIDGGVVADEVSQKDLHIGYDANKGEYVDMVKAGIIDPVKVVRGDVGGDFLERRIHPVDREGFVVDGIGAGVVDLFPLLFHNEGAKVVFAVLWRVGVVGSKRGIRLFMISAVLC